MCTEGVIQKNESFDLADLKRFCAAFFLSILTLALLSCQSVPRPGSELDLLFQKGRAYTLTNLHPDPIRHKLSAVNYLQGGLIPMCSEVEFLSWKSNQITFRVISSGQEYFYNYHAAAVESFEDHLARYFAGVCDKSEVESLPKIDQRGILVGQVLKGMSKRGTVLAIGYPPPHRTPTLDAFEWRYWKNRFNTIAVVFDADGRVTEVRN